MEALTVLDQDIVYVRNEEAVTNSLKVAEIFGKNHRDVIRTIRKKIGNYSKSFAQRNFALSDYQDETGKSNTMYELTRDGFAVLCLGFTGKEAALFQEAFMYEFNRRGKIIQQLNLALPKERRKNHHQFGYHKLEYTPDGKTKHRWITGSKTIEEMTELEKHSWLQSKRVKSCLGYLKKFVGDLPDRDRYEEKYLDLIESIEEVSKKFKFKQESANLMQMPLFEDAIV